MKYDRERVMDLLVEHGPKILGEYYGPNACVASTKATIETLKRFGIRANPLVVRVLILNAVTAKAVEGGLTMREASEIPGNWSIGIEATGEIAEDGNGWDGHLVAVVGGRYIVDLSAGQFARPQHGIKMVPFVVHAEPGWAKGREPLVLAGGEGAVVALLAKPGERSFLPAKDWWHRRIIPVVERVEEAIRQGYEEGLEVSEAPAPAQSKSPGQRG